MSIIPNIVVDTSLPVFYFGARPDSERPVRRDNGFFGGPTLIDFLKDFYVVRGPIGVGSTTDITSAQMKYRQSNTFFMGFEVFPDGSIQTPQSITLRDQRGSPPLLMDASDIAENTIEMRYQARVEPTQPEMRDVALVYMP